ncbi:helix-turn-helix transcriptional regulator [Streptomyces sp. NPDC052309]|uniref:helix-turn-helix domain-containing protein n=1 Tax=Streptomyces TaxID=1883 RepID=UPI002811B10A|nr:helix-turn-helix transcriptional regulator [Streptomyces griseicoloratus]
MVRRIQLGSQLRRLRQAQGITLQEASREVRASETKVSRMELGRVGFKRRDVADLLTLYGVTGEEERAGLLALTEEANAPGWWQQYADVLPAWWSTYLGLEGAASQVHAYEVQFVHGLLQTEDYARTVCRLGAPGARPADVERRVALRLQRQQVLVSDGAPELHVVLDEAVLRRPYGSRATLRGQLQHLLDVSERPNVRLQVMPFQSSGHPVTTGPFTLLSFPQAEVPDVVYVEHLTSALYLDKPQDVVEYTAVLEGLRQDSHTPERSRDLLHRLLLAA